MRTVAVTERPGRNPVGEFRILECDLDRDSLHYLGIVAGRVVRGQQRKLRSAGRGYFDDLAAEDLPGKLVYANLGCIPNPYVSKLGFFVIRLHPSRAIDEGNDLRSGRHQLPRPDLPFADSSIARCRNLRIAEVYLRQDQACLFSAKVGGKLHLLRLEHHLLTPLRFGRQFAASQHGSSLGEVRIATGELTCEPFFVSNRLLQLLLGC